jgi:putative salt-induced outer membrane protein YdiY
MYFRKTKGFPRSRTLAMAAMLTLGLPAIADELVMKDGSRLLGTVLQKDAGSSFDFKTSYAGVITIQWAEVKQLIADEPITVLLKSGNTYDVVSANKTDGGLTTLSGVDTTQTAVLSDVAFFSPDPWRLGHGWHWQGNTNIALAYERGNTDKDDFEADFAMTFRQLNDRVKLNGDYDREKSNEVLTNEDWRLVTRYDHFVSEKLFYGATLGFEHDRFADLQLRTTIGPLVGYEFYDTKAMNLDVAGGPIYVKENFYSAENDEYAALGWQLNFDRFITDSIQFYHRHNGLLSMEDTKNFVWDTWTGLRFPIYAGVVASTEIKVEYDGGAQQGVDKTDTTYSVKLGYEW